MSESSSVPTPTFRSNAGALQGSSPLRTLVGNLGIPEVFARIDTDHNGTISVDELGAALAEFEIEVSEAELHDLVLEVDKDASGEVDLEEFQAAFTSAYLSGGVDVYIPLFWPTSEDKGVEYYESPEFKAKLLCGE